MKRQPDLRATGSSSEHPATREALPALPGACLFDGLALAVLIVATVPAAGSWHSESIPWLIAAAALVGAGIVAVARGAPPIDGTELRRVGAAALVVTTLVGLTRTVPETSSAGDYDAPRLAIHACVLLLAAHRFFLARADGRFDMAAFFALGLLLRLVAIAATPDPHIDVWDCHQAGSDHLLAGRNPFAEQMPNRNALLHGYALSGYPYPPLTLLLLAPFKAAVGDVRYGMVALELLALVALWRAILARSRGVAAALEPFLLCFYLQPAAAVIAEKAWTEPLTIAALALILRFPRSGAVLGLALAIKQYMVSWALLLVTGPGPRLRRAAIACVFAGATTLPFAFADWERFVESVGFSRVAFRLDNLSLNRALHHFFAWHVDPARATALVGAAWLLVAAVAARRGFARRATFVWRLNVAAAFAAHLLGYGFLNNYYYLEGLALLQMLQLATSETARS